MRYQISLTIPEEVEYRGVARLVLGGLAARLNLTYEHLEDLELALEGVLERGASKGDLTVTFVAEGGSIETLVGPFGPDAFRELERPVPEGLGLRRILETVSDGFQLENREGFRWVRVRKSFEARVQGE